MQHLSATVAFVEVSGNRRKLAEAVEMRRLALGLSQDKAAGRGDIAAQTWRTVETHQGPVRKSTLVAIDRALEWPFGTSQRILEGAEPPSPDDTGPGAPALEPHPLELAALSGKIEQLSDEDRKYVEDLVNRLLDQD